MTDSINLLRSHLTRWGRRLRWRDGLWLAARSLWWPILAALVIELAARFWPVPDRHVWALAPLQIWLLGVALYTLLRPLPPEQVARRLDRTLGLKDRLSTALEFSHRPLADLSALNLVQLQWADALAAIEHLPSGALPWRWPRRQVGWAGGLLALVMALGLLPNPIDAILAEQAAVRQAAQEQAQAIETARRDLERATKPTSEERAKALQALADLLKQLAANPGHLEQALADLSEAQARLRQLQSPQAAARQSAAEQIAAQLTALSRGQAQSSPNPEQAAAALMELAAALGQMDAAAQANTAETLESLAAAAAPTDADLAEALQNMAAAVRAGEVGQAVKAAGEAQEALVRSTQAAELQQALAAAQAQLENSRQQLTGQGALAQGQEPGQNQGQGPGQGNQGQGPGPGQQVGGGGGTNANHLPPANRTGAAGAPTQPNKPATVTDSETVFAPVNGPHPAGRPEFVAGQTGPDGQTLIREEQMPQPGLTNPALVPYSQVYQTYTAAAAETMSRERVPPELQNYVRDYFSQLAPE